MEQLKQLAEEKVKYQELAKNVLKQCIQDFMKAQPKVTAIGWVQYTPYFNDGEECVFSMHDVHFSIKLPLTQEDMEEVSYFDGEAGWHPCYGQYKSQWQDISATTGLTEPEFNELKTLCQTLRTLKEELKIVFGDHVKVIVTQEGVFTFEHEHD